ncbi:hypothetical protein L1887_55171 [Cichorium endivia]|nr:hypothetical protein L1887_55171 [Cichorium endivia]
MPARSGSEGERTRRGKRASGDDPTARERCEPSAAARGKKRSRLESDQCAAARHPSERDSVSRRLGSALHAASTAVRLFVITSSAHPTRFSRFVIARLRGARKRTSAPFRYRL